MRRAACLGRCRALAQARTGWQAVPPVALRRVGRAFRLLSGNESGKTHQSHPTGGHEVRDDAAARRETLFGTIPNILTTARLVAAPVVAGLICYESYAEAACLFAAAGALDGLDGYIARNWPGQASVLGSHLDPIADKVLVTLALGSMTHTGILPWPLLAAVALRDTSLVGVASRYRALTRPAGEAFFAYSAGKIELVAATKLSKANTVGQIALVALSLGSAAFDLASHEAWGPTLAATIDGGAWLIAATTIATGFQYLVSPDTRHMLRVVAGARVGAALDSAFGPGRLPANAYDRASVNGSKAPTTKGGESNVDGEVEGDSVAGGRSATGGQGRP